MTYKTVLSACVVTLVVVLISAQENITFFSTQFNTPEEGKLFYEILSDSAYDFIGTEDDLLLAEVLAEADADRGTIDLIGAQHDLFPPLVSAGALVNLNTLLEKLEEDRTFNPQLFQLGHINTDNAQYYIPWMYSTYIMVARNEALAYLPDDADISSLTWFEFAEWCQNIVDGTGEPRCALPYAGSFHHLLQGYFFPSFTGGMVTQFNSAEAVTLMHFLRDDLWKVIQPESLTYSNLQPHLLSDEVWVTIDHTTNLVDLFNRYADQFTGFPPPAGPAGRGYMVIVIGLGIPQSSQHQQEAETLIDYLTTPDVQQQVLEQLSFFPVLESISMTQSSTGIVIQADIVNRQSTASDAILSIPPVGLGTRQPEINQIFRNTFDRIVLDGEAIESVLEEEARNMQALLDETQVTCWTPDPITEATCQIK